MVDMAFGAKVTTFYSQAPHKVASSGVCLRNFSQAGKFCPLDA